MKVPINWLRDYVDFEATPEEVAERLTFSGMEVEGISTVGGDYPDVVVGEVLEIAPHPGADRLRLCRVYDGNGAVRVVCGADNFAVGDKVPLAKVGSVLPGGLKIKVAEIRGERSDGMLCAEDELGLSDDHSGIMLLPADSPAGTPLTDVLGPPDTVLDLEITWNRPDCLSMLGVARELAALFGTELKRPPVDFEERGRDVTGYASVRIDDPDGCPRYTARVLEDVSPGPSPLWMQRRLTLAGVRPISNIVDITNYVLLEYGQPLHAFDHALLKGDEIVVRSAKPGETMQTLDGIDRELTADTLVIADGESPVALAGVMGGADSEIREQTGTVLLESAGFDPARIHATSVRLGLSTESSHRFERGVDIEAVDEASRRAARLMLELAGATAARGVIDVFPRPPQRPRVACRYERSRSIIGAEIPDEEIVSILNSLQLPVVEKDTERCIVEVPSFRHDLEREADLIEEVARMHGVDTVEAGVPRATIVPGASNDSALAVIGCRTALTGLGLTEIVNYSFVSHELLDLFGSDNRGSRVVLPNPVSRDHALLRNTLIPQMAETLARNLSRQVETAAFFELGRTFHRASGDGVTERERACIGLMGKVGRHGTGSRTPLGAEEMFACLKGIVENLSAAERIRDLDYEPFSDAMFGEGQALRVRCGTRDLGILGLLAEPIRAHWRMQDPVGVAELELDVLLASQARAPQAQPVPVYPSVARDVALVVDESVRHAEVLKLIAAAAPSELTDVVLFDTFRSKSIGAGRKSLAYSLTYRSAERTLTDEEVNRYHDTVKDALRSGLSAEIRED